MPNCFGIVALFIFSWKLLRPPLKGVTFLAAGAIKNKTVIGALEWLDRFTYSKADRIVAVTNTFKVHIVAHGRRESKLCRVPHRAPGFGCG
ncbi:MAG: hypothetical protein KJ725_01380 [Gammaproteobacteria bacterium]|uniref:hypothetical protein n=1 Tax=Methylotuvimicrobium sp. TaxID=2822413 RepID=UPI001E0E6399|nr:hypothetical protein [Gammaproteobacteria bacterium]